MPELPEVETVVRQLQKKVVGKRIASIQIIDSKVAPPSITQAQSAVIQEVARLGKSIVMSLSNGLFLVFHLRMTGHFSLNNSKKDYRSAVFQFSSKDSMAFHSIRRFSRVHLLTQQQLDKKKAVMGPDPFALLPEDFAVMAKRYPQANLKNKLLDQSFLSGVGNIYAQEALYHAGIHPRKKIAGISKPHLEQAHRELQRILQLSIANNGTTVYNYGHLDGKGDFQHLLAVYDRETCPQGHGVKRMVVGGRGTYYCGKCQR